MARKVLVTCSGVSNTGKLTLQTAKAVMQRNPWIFEKQISASDLNEGYRDLLHDDVKIIVLDGCPDCCSCKKLKPLNIEPDIHIIATDHGIEKKGMDDPLFTEINALSGVLKARVKTL